MSARNMNRIAVETGASVMSVRRWADHKEVASVTAYAFAAAARRLRIKRPARKTRRVYVVKATKKGAKK